MENNQDGMAGTKDLNNNQKSCNCKMCRMGGAHVILRWILGVVILLIVFWLGIMVGTFRHSHGSLRSGYMVGHYPNPVMRAYPMSGSGYGSGAMRGGAGGITPQSATTTPVK